MKKYKWDIIGTCNVVLSVVVSALLGRGIFYVVYELNKPLGINYATYASYFITAGLVIVFNVHRIKWVKQ